MEGLVCIVVVILFVVVPFVIRAIAESGEQRSYQAAYNQQIYDAQQRGISVHCRHDTVVVENDELLPVLRVEITGAIVVPFDGQQVMIRVWLLDVTDNTAEPHAVFCMIPDLADEDGLYTYDQETTIPYQFAEVSGMEVAVIPSPALLLPKKGQRRLQVCVAITHPLETDKAYAYGDTVILHQQATTGYLEFKQRSIEQERWMAMLALSVSAVDGHIDRRETAVIRRFFAEHLAERTDEAERKQRIEATLKETFNTLQAGSEKPSELIKRLCKSIRNDGDPSFAQAAYELCVQVAAADDTIEDIEQRGLKYIAHNLQLPDDFVREVHDRNLRLAMYDKADDEAILEMPPGLSHEEKIEFLNQEYRKWRSRAAHKDPAVATEANIRLQQITRARRQLQEA